MRSLVAALMVLPTGSVAAENLSLPFSGRWFVAQAGDTPNVNHHMTSPAQAYGIDFAKVGGPSGRELKRSNDLRVTDFYSWGESVLAPAGGTVVAVVAGLPDNPLGSRDTQNPGGNYVAIRIHEGRFVFLGHLQQNTVTLRPGDSVRRAQPPTFGPIDVELTGKRLEAVTWPLIRGLFVSNAVDSAAQRTRFSPARRAGALPE